MQTNRDDFIIAIRSAFLKKGNQQRFSLIALILFSIFIIVLGKYNFKGINFLKLSIKEIVYRTTFIVSVPENFVISSYHTISDHFNLYSNYENLKKDTNCPNEQVVALLSVIASNYATTTEKNEN